MQLLKQSEAKIRLFMADGSERSDYMPQAEAIRRLGRPHAGINLMACYYPDQTFWPERRLFSQEVPHYRHSVKDQTATTKLGNLNDWTDGYYSFDINNPNNDVISQAQDVRRHGQDVRLTLTADIDTKNADLEKIGDMLKDFGPVELRLNHEANGCTWFRFAKNVGDMKGAARTKLYYRISQFFIRAHKVMRAVAPNVSFVGCYNGPGERALKGELAPGEMPHLENEELGLMYEIPDVLVSLDQYGSLHYGWPGHQITNPPIIGGVNHDDHNSFALGPWGLCELVIRPFQKFISRKRGVATRIDLGELDFDEDIHGAQIRAQLLHECYSWIQRHPKVIGSTTFYELTDMGGLGLFRQKAYGNLKDLKENIVTDVYRRIMAWPEFVPQRALKGTVKGTQVDLRFASSSDATALEIELGANAKAVDFGESYWRRVVFVQASGAERFIHTDARRLEVPMGATRAIVFALPADGRNNKSGAYVRTVPVPVVS
jgi:hypothetical protein